MTNSLSDRVLKRIETDGLTPRSRYYFIVKNDSLWALGLLSVCFGALATTAALFEVTSPEWITEERSLPLSYIIEAAPYLWILAICLFIGIGYFTIRHTRYGYRYSVMRIALALIALSLTLGLSLFSLGAGQVIDERMGTLMGIERKPALHAY